jgi:hypothetical protein
LHAVTIAIVSKATSRSGRFGSGQPPRRALVEREASSAPCLHLGPGECRWRVFTKNPPQVYQPNPSQDVGKIPMNRIAIAHAAIVNVSPPDRVGSISPGASLKYIAVISFR